MRNLKRITIALLLAAPVAVLAAGAQAKPGTNSGRSPQAGGLPATNARVTALEKAVGALGAATSFASIDSDGDVSSSKGVDVGNSGSTGTGVYEVAFTSDVSACAAVATAHDEGAGAVVVTMVSRSSSTKITVTTFDVGGGAAVDNGFDLVVTCAP